MTIGGIAVIHECVERAADELLRTLTPNDRHHVAEVTLIKKLLVRQRAEKCAEHLFFWGKRHFHSFRAGTSNSTIAPRRVMTNLAGRNPIPSGRRGGEGRSTALLRN